MESEFCAPATRSDDLTEDAIAELVRKLPKPRFDADRRLAKYDRLEREAEAAHR